jgi:pimeloyl-ACP methyl ester carboxylesterase
MPTTFQGWVGYVIDLVEALGIQQMDLLGFSMGDGAAQHVALKAPHLVRKLILAGTRTSKTPNTTRGSRDIFLPLANSVTKRGFEPAYAQSFSITTQIGKPRPKLLGTASSYEHTIALHTFAPKSQSVRSRHTISSLNHTLIIHTNGLASKSFSEEIFLS